MSRYTIIIIVYNSHVKTIRAVSSISAMKACIGIIRKTNDSCLNFVIGTFFGGSCVAFGDRQTDARTDAQTD